MDSLNVHIVTKHRSVETDADQLALAADDRVGELTVDHRGSRFDSDVRPDDAPFYFDAIIDVDRLVKGRARVITVSSCSLFEERGISVEQRR